MANFSPEKKNKPRPLKICFHCRTLIRQTEQSTKWYDKYFHVECLAMHQRINQGLPPTFEVK